MDELKPQDYGQAEGIVKMSEPKIFYYETEIEWTKEKEGQIGGPTLPAVSVGAPPEFKGREGKWTPEHLFGRRLTPASCRLSWRSRKIPSSPLVSFRSTVKAKLETVQGSGYQFTEIVIKPSVVIASRQ